MSESKQNIGNNRRHNIENNRRHNFRMWIPCEKIMVYRNLTDRDWYYHPTECSPAFRAMPEDSSRRIMQYTCIKDRNGEGIYEGDIVKAYPNCIVAFPDCIVAFGKYCIDYDGSETEVIGFHLLDKDHQAFELDPRDSNEMEIVGNIYENPELLTVKEQ